MDMKKYAVILLASVFLFTCVQSVLAVENSKVSKPSKADVVTFVNKAVDYAKKNGKEKALKEFMNKKGAFVKGELYIYAYDFKGTVIAHGGQPDLVGKNLIDMKDKNGVMVIQGLIKLAKSGGGWLKYLWPNPLDNNKIEPKLGYAKKVDDTWWLGSGIYE
jgi:cytochrome c